MGGILASTQRRLKFFAATTILFGFITFVASLTIFDWACKLDTLISDQEFNCEDRDDKIFGCHERQSWKQTGFLAVLASVYQMISSMFFFQARLGMTSWIVGNTLIGIFSAFFSYFIMQLWPTLITLYLGNAIVVSVCSLLGYFVKNMTSFEESTTALLT